MANTSADYPYAESASVPDEAHRCAELESASDEVYPHVVPAAQAVYFLANRLSELDLVLA